MNSKRWIKYLISAMIILTIVIVGIIFFYNKSNNKTSATKNKIEDELEYLDSTIIYMINGINNLNNINSIKILSNNISSSIKENSEQSSNQETEETTDKTEETDDSEKNNNETKNMEKYSIQTNSIMLRDKNNVNWDDLENQAENLYSTWMTITVDLTNENIPNETILAYNENLDNLLTELKKYDKNNSAICLANLYNLTTKYMEEISNDKEKINVERIKSNVISAYSIVDSERWEDINKILSQAEVNLTNLINSSTSSKDTKQAKINKCYVLLKELIKSSNEKDKDTFYLKYVNLINELEKI